MSQGKSYFYGKPIYEKREAEIIKNLLKKYKGKKVTDELKEQIWDELQREKFLGNINIPFKIVTRKDEYGRFPDTIEVILDTKL